MKTCLSCGKEIPETAKVCGYCGTKQAVEPPPPPPNPVETVQEPVPPVAPVKEQPPEPLPPPEPEPDPEPVPEAEPEPEPEPVRKAAPEKSIREQKKEPEGKRSRWWLWLILAIALIAAVYLLIAPRLAMLPSASVSTPDNRPIIGGESDQPSQPEKEDLPQPEEEDPQPPPEEETLSGVFIGLEFVEEIIFTNPQEGIGDSFETLDGEGIRVTGYGEEWWAYYEIAHDLSDGEAVFVLYEVSPDAVSSIVYHNNLGWWEPDFRGFGWYIHEEDKQVLKYISDEAVGLELLEDNRMGRFELVLAMKDGKILIREEGPEGFYSFEEYWGPDFSGEGWMVQLNVRQGEVEVYESYIFTFDDWEID